jgi:predicted ATPase/serine phosphatase RsbU (regulator of sigma subunit)
MSKFNIPGYKLSDEIYVSQKSVIYRAVRAADNTPVILKILTDENADRGDLRKLIHEYEVLNNLNTPGVIRVFGIEHYQGLHALVLEDFGGISLKAYLSSIRIDVITFLQIGIQLVNTLDGIHRNNIIHKDINPSNILINTDTGKVKVIDFGIASLIQSETPVLNIPQMLEGTLQYISPEQTGRMNHPVDYRSDYYSLGMTFYNMFIGWVPFQSDDPLELIHEHLTRHPVPPCELNRGIPQVVSDIVMKLLAKIPEERYQSTYGLKYDLEKCLVELQKRGEILYFTLGSVDISDRFHIAQKLYGREKELEMIGEAYNRCRNGNNELIIITGQAGMGKTSIINELKMKIGLDRSIFIGGKFDQMNINIPYAAWTEALQQLMYYILTLPEGKLSEWKTRIEEAIKPNARILIDVIPGLDKILGEQPPAQQLPTVESQNRLNSVFQNFIKVIPQPDQPLIIFFDDLQWADVPSIKSIQLILPNPEIRNIMIIWLAREEELESIELVQSVIEENKKAGVSVTKIDLTPLPVPVIDDLITDTLKSDLSETMALAALVHHKTEGNPYFINEFLKYLHKEKAIVFDPEVRSWNWEIDRIQRIGITDNVVTFMTDKIQKLSPSTIDALVCAACIGTTFDLNILAPAYGKSQIKTAADLWEAIQEGLIIPIGDAYKFISDSNGEGQALAYQLPVDYSEVIYKFSHDRVRESVYSLLQEDKRNSTHLNIGYSLLHAVPRESVEDKVFEIVNQLNLGRHSITDRIKILELARLNLIAGKKAKAAIALEAAYGYLTIGYSLLENAVDEEQYVMEMEFLNSLSECAYLLGKFDIAERHFVQNLQKVRSDVEKSQIYQKMVLLYTHSGEHDKAIEAIRLGLSLVGESIPARPGKLSVFRELMKVRFRVGRKKIDSLAQLPNMTDKAKMIALEILMDSANIAYSASREFSGLTIAKMVDITLRYGLAPASSFALGIYGLILNSGFGAFKTGYEFGKLGLAISEKLNDRYFRGKANFLMASVINHWRNHARTNLNYLHEGRKLSMESGDFKYASYADIHLTISSMFIGNSLEEILHQANQGIEFGRKIHYDDVVLALTGYRQFVLNLQGLTKGVTDFNTEDFQEIEFSKKLDASKFTVAKMYYFVLKIASGYLFGKYTDCLDFVDRSKGLTYNLAGQLVETEYYFYESLLLTASYEETPPRKRKEYKKILAGNLKRFKRWTEHSPENFETMYLLLQAEVSVIYHHVERAMNLYDEAIQSAKENQFIHMEALANERTGLFYLSRNKKEIAGVYLAEARRRYAAWGAHAKVSAMNEKHPEIFEKKISEKKQADSSKVGTSTEMSFSTIDYISLLKASQALSEEIEYEKVMKNMMRIVLENAGAERGYFISEIDNTHMLSASASAGEHRMPTLMHIPLLECSDLSHQIVQYVGRAKKSVVLNDASRESAFAADPYIVRASPKSILCTPIIHQGKLAGILYLENNLIPGAFTEERFQILNHLSSQIAISIENAHLHEQEKELVRIREEVQVASRIQRDLLPDFVPEITGYELCGINLPAQIVGGDYYDYIRIDQDKIALCLGDVSGKGLPAALLMANLQATLRAQIMNSESVKECIDRSNKLLCKSTGADRFITLFCGVLDTNTHRFTFTNAGHDSPFFFGENDSPSRLVTESLVLGMMEDFPYTEQTVTFQAGDLLVIYSDGVSEAMNEQNEDFGESRFEKLILNNRNMPVNKLTGLIVNELKSHIGNAPQSDDITLLIVRRTPN